MARQVRIALDGFGGDHGLSSTVPGALRALEADPDLELLFVAGEGSLQGASHPRLRGVVSQGALPDGGHPAALLRSTPDLSVGLATRLVAKGEADAIVSMGHTGATMIAARWFLKPFPGVDRPPAATTMPLPVENPPVLLDLGANSTCSARDLLSFAALGTAYSQAVRGKETPRVALVANGTEEGKGTPLLQEAYSLLKASSLNFVGYVEPVTVGEDSADVLVTDGFTGNMLLKWMEGLARTLLVAGKSLSPLPQAGRFFSQLEKMTDVTRSDDNILMLGVQGIVVPGHGRAGPDDVFRALTKAAESVRSGLTEKMEAVLKKIPLGKE